MKNGNNYIRALTYNKTGNTYFGIIRECPHCNAENLPFATRDHASQKQTLYYENYKLIDEDDIEPSTDPRFSYTLYNNYLSIKCVRCSNTFIANFAQLEDHFEDNFKCYTYTLSKSIDKKSTYLNHDPNLQTDYNEFLLNSSVGSYLSTVLMGRRLLQRICREILKVNNIRIKSKNLINEIQEIANNNLISKRTKDLILKIKQLGNLAAHPDKDLANQSFDKDDAELYIDCIDLVISEVYGVGEIYEKLKNNPKLNS